MTDAGRSTSDQDEFESCAMRYVDIYIDAAQNLPNDIQRLLSEIRELDALTCMELRDYEQRHKSYLEDIRSGDSAARRRSHNVLRRSLLQEREYGDERLQLASQLIDLIEAPAKQLEEQLQALEATQYEAELTGTSYRAVDEVPQPPVKIDPKSRGSKFPVNGLKRGSGKQTGRRPREPDDLAKSEKKTTAGGEKKLPKGGRRGNKVNGKTPVIKPVASPTAADVGAAAISPDEPIYCLCQRISFGEMIGCDNEECPIEWFHFECVGLTSKPKGKWYCPRCRKEQSRGDKAKSTKSSAS